MGWRATLHIVVQCLWSQARLVAWLFLHRSKNTAVRKADTLRQYPAVRRLELSSMGRTSWAICRWGLTIYRHTSVISAIQFSIVEPRRNQLDERVTTRQNTRSKGSFASRVSLGSPRSRMNRETLCFAGKPNQTRPQWVPADLQIDLEVAQYTKLYSGSNASLVEL